MLCHAGSGRKGQTERYGRTDRIWPSAGRFSGAGGSVGRQRSGLRRAQCSRLLPILLLALPIPWLLQPRSASASEQPSSCITCHRNPDFLVTNKKLYDYFQQWQSSVHKQEGVSCEDCHGGDATSSDKNTAHGKGIGGAARASGVNFANIPTTCGECHSEILEGFRKSAHFEHLVAEAQEDQGPTCVTCHGSINVNVLNVTSVGASCARCHNEESDNHPENPEKATAILNKFLSIHRFYRYITVRAEPADARKFFRDMDKRLQHLSVTWHTFDLPEIRKETEQVLSLLRAKRDELRNKPSTGK